MIEHAEGLNLRPKALLETTSSYPSAIIKTISTIRSKLPSPMTLSSSLEPQQPLPAFVSSSTPASPAGGAKLALPNQAPLPTGPGSSSVAQIVHSLLTRQDTLTTGMAHNLESLAAHYDQMSQVLRDHGLCSTETDSSPTLIVGSAETYKAPAMPSSFSPPRDTQSYAKGIDMPGRSRTMTELADEDMQGGSVALAVSVNHQLTSTTKVFTRDTEELPAIINDIDRAAQEINSIQ